MEYLEYIDGGFPVYILDDDDIEYLKEDCDHSQFWHKVVSKIVAEKTGIPLRNLINLPYCQRRARVVGNKIYYGEKMSFSLFKKIKNVLKIELDLCYDEHESRCEISVLEFKGMKKIYKGLNDNEKQAAKKNF